MAQLEVYFDGSVEGNPGPGWIGVLVLLDGQAVEEITEPIGRTTSNAAEYRALIRAVEAALKLAPDAVTFYSDSQLVVNQVQGRFACRSPHLQRLLARAQELLDQLPSWELVQVPRERNLAHPLAQGPRDRPWKRFYVTLTPEEVARIKALARARGLKPDELVREWIREALDSADSVGAGGGR